MEKDKIKKRIFIISALIVTLILTLLVLYFESKVEKVEISGLTKYSNEEFEEYTGVHKVLDNTYLFYLKYMFSAKEDIPYIEDYEIKIADKNTLEITVYENSAIGCVNVMGSYFCFDRKGVIISSSNEIPEGIPLVTGLEFGEIVVLKQLMVQNNDYFNRILDIIKPLRDYRLICNEIHIDDDENITLYYDRLTVELGKGSFYKEKISALAGMYEQASTIGGTLYLNDYSDQNTNVILKNK